MLVAILLQAVIGLDPHVPPQDRQAELDRRIECNQRITKAEEPAKGVLRAPVGKTQKPLWRPGDNPEEGLYAPVARMVDGCPVPTPISLPFALKR